MEHIILHERDRALTLLTSPLYKDIERSLCQNPTASVLVPPVMFKNRDKLTHIFIQINPTHPSNIPHSLKQLNLIPTCGLEPPPALAVCVTSRNAARTLNIPKKPWGVRVSITVYDDGEEVGETIEIRITWFKTERDGRCECHIGEKEGGHIWDYFRERDADECLWANSLSARWRLFNRAEENIYIPRLQESSGN